jgi:hypothetical protein
VRPDQSAGEDITEKNWLSEPLGEQAAEDGDPQDKDEGEDEAEIAYGPVPDAGTRCRNPMMCTRVEPFTLYFTGNLNCARIESILP